jgi:hypothetical protein
MGIQADVAMNTDGGELAVLDVAVKGLGADGGILP